MHGINEADINKLADAGFKTVESLIYSTKKNIAAVKGIGDNKVEKILEAGKILSYSYFS